MRGRDGGAPIERVGSVGSRLEEVVERTRDRLGVMIEREQIAILVGAQAQGLPRRRPVAYRTEHLFTTQDELDWPSHSASRDGAENLRSGDEAFAAKAAAEKRAANVNVVGRYSEQAGKPRLRDRETLARRIDRQGIAIPRSDDRMRLHGIVKLGRGLVGLSNLSCRRRQPGLDVAARNLRRVADTDSLRHEAFGCIEADPRRFDLVARRRLRGGVRGGLEWSGNDDRGGLVGVARPVALREIEAKHEGV